MSLRDFMQQLQEEEEGVVYSSPPEDAIQVIPPVVVNSTERVEPIKVIPPNANPPKVIKFKFKESTSTNPSSKVVLPPKKEEEPTKSTSKVVTTLPNNTLNSHPEKVLNTGGNDASVDQLFMESGTSLDKKDIWIGYYNKATNSKKEGLIVTKMKQGRFRVLSDNEDRGPIKAMPDVEILSDYKTHNKTVKDMLDDKWL